MSAPDASDAHRYRCEVRQLLVWRRERGSAWVHEFINGREVTLPSGRKSCERNGVRQIRGDAAADRLLADCCEQWTLGNTGEPGDWREPAAAPEAMLS